MPNPAAEPKHDQPAEGARDDEAAAPPIAPSSDRPAEGGDDAPAGSGGSPAG